MEKRISLGGPVNEPRRFENLVRRRDDTDRYPDGDVIIITAIYRVVE